MGSPIDCTCNALSSKSEPSIDPFVPDFDPEDYRSIRTFLSRIDLLLIGHTSFPWTVVKLLISKAMRGNKRSHAWWEATGKRCQDITSFREVFIREFESKSVEDRIDLDLVKLAPKSTEDVHDLQHYLDQYAEIALFSKQPFSFHQAVILSKVASNASLNEILQKKKPNIRNLWDLCETLINCLTMSELTDTRRHTATGNTLSRTKEIKRINTRRSNSIRRPSIGDISSSSSYDSTKSSCSSLSKATSSSTLSSPGSSRRYMGYPLKLKSLKYPIFSLFGQIELPFHKSSVWVNICLRTNSSCNFASEKLIHDYLLTERYTGRSVVVCDNYNQDAGEYYPEEPIPERTAELTIQLPCDQIRWFTFTAKFHICKFQPVGLTLGQPWFDQHKPTITNNRCILNGGEHIIRPNYIQPK